MTHHEDVVNRAGRGDPVEGGSRSRRDLDQRLSPGGCHLQ